MSADLHDRARELEELSARIRGELDAIYSVMTPEEDGFMARMAERFRAERDTARRELAMLMAQLSSDNNELEVRALEAERKLREAVITVGVILNTPKSSRSAVQSALLLLNEKIR